MTIPNLFALALCVPAIIVGAQAQGFSVLYSFGQGSGATNGSSPRTSLVLSGNKLYGVAPYGGTSEGDPPEGGGTIFGVNTDGAGITILNDFAGINPGTGKNSGGVTPDSILFLSGNLLYGTTVMGGTNGYGTLFAVSTGGTNFATLHNFTSSENRAIILSTLSGNTLYGTTENPPFGSVIAINTDGSNFRTLYAFHGASDGAEPGALILSGDVFYGTAGLAGTGGQVFMVATNGDNFTTLHTFTNGNDGTEPGGLVLSGNRLYGIAQGGTNGTGTIFALNTNGMDFTILYSFSEGFYDSHSGNFTNSDGAYLFGLFLSGNTLYGTANAGGTNGYGTVFAVNTDGTGFTTLHNFNGGDGAGPQASPILSGNTLYGTTSGIVTYPGLASVTGNQTVFALTVPPALGITAAGNRVVISWTASAPNYVLRTSTNLSSGPWSNITTGISTNGLDYFHTNAVTSPAAFFSLKQQ
jgi:uncharacterized repeat protein (TIGR03803 family)